MLPGFREAHFGHDRPVSDPAERHGQRWSVFRIDVVGTQYEASEGVLGELIGDFPGIMDGVDPCLLMNQMLLVEFVAEVRRQVAASKKVRRFIRRPFRPMLLGGFGDYFLLRHCADVGCYRFSPLR